MKRIIGLFLFLTSCAKVGGGGDTKFLVPWPTGDGHYHLEVITISTLASPEELRGEAAEIYYRSGFNENGYQGSIARPRLMRSGDVYVPRDFESSLAVAVYAQMDRIFLYERKQGTQGQINWPRRVGVDLNMVGPEGKAHDNAHYFTNLDIMGLLPYSRAGGVPIAANHGIVAHEHFHAHFQSQVMNPLNAMPESVISSLTQIFYPAFLGKMAAVTADPNVTVERTMNEIVLRAWNEGLADVTAGIYTRQSDFFSVTLPELGSRREMNAAVGPLWTSRDLQRLIDRRVVLTNDVKMDIAYGQGSVLARLVYQLAQSGVETPDAFSKRIHERLPVLTSRIRSDVRTKMMDFERVIPILLEGFKVNKQACTLLNGAVSKNTIHGSFAACEML